VFALPDGSYDWQDFQFSIQCQEALRAIQIQPTLGQGAKGTLRLARGSRVDAAGREYVVDPEFAQWYEPLPEALREPIDAAYTELRGRLEGLRHGLAQDKPRESVAPLAACIARLRELVKQHRAENGCRRVLRDLETVERHVASIGVRKPGR